MRFYKYRYLYILYYNRSKSVLNKVFKKLFYLIVYGFLLTVIINIIVDYLEYYLNNKIDNPPNNFNCSIENDKLLTIKEGAKHSTCIYETFVTKIYKNVFCIKYIIKPIIYKIYDQKKSDEYLLKYFYNISGISTPYKFQNQRWYYKNYNLLKYQDLLSEFEKIDNIAYNNNIIIDDLVLYRNVLIKNKSKALIIDGNDINILLNYDIFWFPLAIMGCRSAAKYNGQLVELCSFKGFLNSSANFKRCLSFCFKEKQLFPYRNLYGNNDMAILINKLDNKNNYIEWDNKIICLINFILLNILIITCLLRCLYKKIIIKKNKYNYI